VDKKKLEDVQIKLRNQIETLNDTITKLERVNSDTLSDYQALSNENIVLKKVLLHLLLLYYTTVELITNILF